LGFGRVSAIYRAIDPFFCRSVYHLFSDNARNDGMKPFTRPVTAMPGRSIARRFNRAAQRFAAAREGNIAMTFAIALLPLLGFVGAAIDYSRAANARSSMQAALDSTSLMLSKDLSTGTITQSQISTKAVSYFTALYTNKDAQSVSINATYTAGSGTTGNSVKVDGSGSIVTDFMKIAGFPTMGFNATSTYLGHEPAPCRARARQHGIDGRLQQDRRAADSGQESGHPALQPRRQQRRRLHLGDPVLGGRQCRHGQRRRQLAALGSLGSREQPV
jgi:Flp pilus assembly protein TadG